MQKNQDRTSKGVERKGMQNGRYLYQYRHTHLDRGGGRIRSRQKTKRYPEGMGKGELKERLKSREKDGI
jgi:hypothetical protein